MSAERVYFLIVLPIVAIICIGIAVWAFCVRLVREVGSAFYYAYNDAAMEIDISLLAFRSRWAATAAPPQKEKDK